MRIQETPRTPDETFYFDRSQGYSELVVSQDALGHELWPNVEVYTDQSVLMTVEKQTGEIVTRGILPHAQHRLYPGERIRDVKTGSEEARQVEVAGNWHGELGGEQTGIYVVGDEDELLVRRDHSTENEPERNMALPSRTFLPGVSGTSYQALGIMRPSGALVAWGIGARHLARLVDLAHANSLAHTDSDWYRLKDELDRNEHLVGIVGSTLQVHTYLGHFLQKHGMDFMPTRDPREH